MLAVAVHGDHELMPQLTGDVEPNAQRTPVAAVVLQPDGGDILPASER